MKRIKITLELSFCLIAINACVDELDIVTITEDNQGLLVVEANFTDRLENQVVRLSRLVQRLDIETDTTFNRFIPLGLGERDSVVFESNALFL